MNDETTTLLQAEGLARRYGRRQALHPLDLTIESGSIVGLVGPNGSGKTTLLRMVAGFARPTKGSIRVFGLDPYRHRAAVMERARFAFAPPPLYESLTAREHLRFLAGIGGRRLPKTKRSDVDRALSLVGLSDRARDRVRTFSFGMRQRLVLAQALLPMPELLVLDEPTDGLDPLAVLELRSVLERLREEFSVTVFLASHLLIEVDRLVDRLLVLDEGKRLFWGPPEALRDRGETMRLVVGDPDRVFAKLEERGFACERIDGALVLPLDTLSLEEARELVLSEGSTLKEFYRDRPSLEEALLRHLREARSEKEEAGSC